MKNRIGGRIYGRNLSQISFVYDSIQPNGEPTPIELGQILAIDDEISQSKFLIRVTDIEYGQNDQWSKEIARDLNELSTANFAEEHADATDLYRADMRKQMFFQSICEPLGIMNNQKKFVSPKRLPAYFSPVFKVTETDFGEDLKSQLGDLAIGKLRSGSETLNIDAGLFSKLLPYHIGVFAKTGGGKSNTMKVVLGTIMETMGKSGALIFEPHGEYIQDLKRHPLAKDALVCFTQEIKKGDPSRKIRISYQDITVAALMNVRDNLHWTDAQERFLREASYSHEDWLFQLLNLPLNDLEMTMDDPMNLMEMFPDYKEDTLKAIRSKLRQVIDAPYVSEDPSVSNVNEILSLLEQGKTVLIDMASLSGLQELLLSTILANKVLEKRRRMYAQDREHLDKVSPTISIVMEEAQRVLGKNASPSSIFAQVVNEGRKFKVGLVAITQQPKLMNEILISQFNTLIILSISDQKDFDVLKSTSQKSLDQLREEIKSLMPGQAIVSTPYSPFAVPLQVYHYEDYIDMAKQRHKTSNTSPTKGSFKGFV